MSFISGADPSYPARTNRLSDLYSTCCKGFLRPGHCALLQAICLHALDRLSYFLLLFFITFHPISAEMARPPRRQRTPAVSASATRSVLISGPAADRYWAPPPRSRRACPRVCQGEDRGARFRFFENILKHDAHRSRWRRLPPSCIRRNHPLVRLVAAALSRKSTPCRRSMLVFVGRGGNASP